MAYEAGRLGFTGAFDHPERQASSVVGSVVFGGPQPIDGTAAALDPALWVLGRKGCSVCEREGRKIEVGSICQLCPLGRIVAEDG